MCSRFKSGRPSRPAPRSSPRAGSAPQHQPGEKLDRREPQAPGLPRQSATTWPRPGPPHRTSRAPGEAQGFGGGRLGQARADRGPQLGPRDLLELRQARQGRRAPGGWGLAPSRRATVQQENQRSDQPGADDQAREIPKPSSTRPEYRAINASGERPAT